MPDALDTIGSTLFVGVFLGLPALGWVAMYVDYRAYYRRLKGALVLVRQYALQSPLWALRQQPACLSALGLESGCSREDVMRAYRQRVKAVHPDHGGDRRRFEELQARLAEALRLVEAEAAEAG